MIFAATLGMLCIYFPRPGDLMLGDGGVPVLIAAPVAAIVTRVHPDGRVNLRIFPDGANCQQFHREGVVHGHGPGQWDFAYVDGG